MQDAGSIRKSCILNYKVIYFTIILRLIIYNDVTIETVDT